MKYCKLIICAFILCCCVSCNEDISKIALQEKVSELTLRQKMNEKLSELTEMAELGSVEYTVTKAIKASDDKKWYKKMFGDRKIIFYTTAHLKAGIDLGELIADSIQVDEKEKSVIVTLPHAKLLSMNMPPEEITVAFEKVSGARFKLTATERNEILKQGEASIRASIPTLGILNDAEKNAKSFFQAMLKQMGFEKVTVKFK